MRELFLIALSGLLIGIALAITIPNYVECRRAGFGIRYCATTHILRWRN